MGKVQYKVFVSTWNVGAIRPTGDLSLEDWLDISSSSSYDIYVLGFQEIVPLSSRNVLGPERSKIAKEWNSLIGATLNGNMSLQPIRRCCCCQKTGGRASEAAPEHHKVHPVKDVGDHAGDKFTCIASKQMVGILIAVWVRTDLLRFVSRLGVSSVGCGVMGCLKNKGSVAVRFRLHEAISFCFVCCHLASGGKEGDERQRNSNATDVLARTWFSGDGSPVKILDHDCVVLLGDLNYRISLPDSATRSLVQQKEWKILLHRDQLRLELSRGRAFAGWSEGAIAFPPTYKYHPNSDEYCWNIPRRKGRFTPRPPAWCDRILWVGEGLKLDRYDRSELKLSDHRPVRAVFTAEAAAAAAAAAVDDAVGECF